MADWNNPTTASNYSTGVLQTLKDRDFDAISLCLVDPSNMVDGFIKLSRSPIKFQERSSGAWVDRLLDLTGGGTGASTPSAARTNLGLGTMATQNSSAVSISGGTIAGDGSGLTSLAAANITSGGTLPNLNGSNLTNLNASNLASGTVPTARLGSGAASSTTFLRGDGSWAVVPFVKSIQHIDTTVDSSSGSSSEGYQGYQDVTITALTNYLKAVIIPRQVQSTGTTSTAFKLTSNTNMRVFFKNTTGSDPAYPVKVDILELDY
jgi:hypothetical protein